MLGQTDAAMDSIQASLLPWLTIYVLVLARVGGFVAFAWPLRAMGLSRAVRALLAGLFALMIVPTQVGTVSLVWEGWFELVPMIAREVGIGGLFGLALSAFFVGIQFAGRWIGQLTGWQIGEMLDPTADSDTSPLGRFFGVFAISSFFLIGGHRQVIAAFLESFRDLPMGLSSLSDSAIREVALLVGGSFEVAIRAGAPVVVTLVATSIVLAIVNRALPQLGLIAVGLPLRALVALAALAATLTGLSIFIHEEMTFLVRALSDSLAA